MSMKVKFFILFLMALLITSCGQKGALYLPQESTSINHYERHDS